MTRWGWMIMLALTSISFAERITLEEAVVRAQRDAPSVRLARQQYLQAREQSRQALGLLGFRLDSQAVYERYLPSQSFGPGSPSSSDAKRVALTLSYPVDVLGLNRKTAAAARKNEDAASEAIEAELNRVRGIVREAYVGVLQAQDSVAVRERALASIQGTLANLQKRFAAGDIPRFDVVRLETEVVRGESELITARNNLRLAEQVLNNAMARPVDAEIEVEPVDMEVTLPGNGDGLVALAEQNRPELRQLQNLLVAREFVTFATRIGNSPTLSVAANQLFTIDPGPFNNGSQATISATLSFPLFDSGITRSRIRESKILEDQIRSNLDQTKLGIALEVRSNWVRLQNALQRLASARKAVELQTEALRLATLRYENQVGILLDVTIARNDLTEAELNLSLAQYDALAAQAALRRAVGTDDLNPQPNS